MTSITLSPDFDEWSRASGVTRNHALGISSDPDQTQVIELSGLQIRMYSKFIGKTKPSSVVFLIEGETPEGESILSCPIRVYEDFYPEARSLPPLELLQLIVERFGLEMHITGIRKHVARFFLRKEIPVAPPDFKTQIAVKGGRQGDPALANFIMKKDPNRDLVICLLCFCLDVGPYGEYLARTRGRR